MFNKKIQMNDLWKRQAEEAKHKVFIRELTEEMQVKFNKLDRIEKELNSEVEVFGLGYVYRVKLESFIGTNYYRLIEDWSVFDPLTRVDFRVYAMQIWLDMKRKFNKGILIK